jgi:flavin reductase
MRLWTTGVAVVTSQYQGKDHGMTVNSLTSVSLEPPTILVSLDRDSRTCAMILKSGIFGVTILAADQQHISERFAGRSAESQNRFEGIAFQRLPSGAPFIAGGLAYLDCQVCNTMDVSTHTLFFGNAEHIQIAQGGDIAPLLYYNRAYSHIATRALT